MRELKENYAAWNLKLADFPENGNLNEKLTFFARFGILAANIHNTQPWRFKILKNTIKVFPDWNLQLQKADPLSKNLFISLGCCVRNIEAIAASKEFFSKVNLKNSGKQSYIELVFEQSKKIDSGLASLGQYIARRYSYKLSYKKKNVSKSILKQLNKTEVNSAKVIVTQDSSVINACAELQRKTLVSLSSDQGFANELAVWLQPSDSDEFHGMPGFVAGLSNDQSIMVRKMIKENPGFMANAAESDKKLLWGSPAVGLIVSRGDNEVSWVNTGRVYETVALKAISLGLNVTPMQALVEDRINWKDLNKLFNLKNMEKPTMFFRLGYAKNIKYHTPRKTLEMVLI